jgi:hypothetical protein
MAWKMISGEKSVLKYSSPADSAGRSRVVVMVVAHWFRPIKAVARCQTEQPGVDHQPVRLVETLLRAEALWTARSPPAIIRSFGAAPPSASVETRKGFHDRRALDANRER